MQVLICHDTVIKDCVTHLWVHDDHDDADVMMMS